MIRDIVNNAADKAGGQCRLAAELGIDGSTISRFLSGEGGLKIEHIEKILEYVGSTLIERREIEELKMTAKSLAKFWAAGK